MSNPTRAELQTMVFYGEKNTWPVISKVRAHTAVELCLERCVQSLRKRLTAEVTSSSMQMLQTAAGNVGEHETAAPSRGRANSAVAGPSIGRVPSFYTVPSLLNLSGLSVADRPELPSIIHPSHAADSGAGGSPARPRGAFALPAFAPVDDAATNEAADENTVEFIDFDDDGSTPQSSRETTPTGPGVAVRRRSFVGAGLAQATAAGVTEARRRRSLEANRAAELEAGEAAAAAAAEAAAAEAATAAAAAPEGDGGEQGDDAAAAAAAARPDGAESPTDHRVDVRTSASTTKSTSMANFYYRRSKSAEKLPGFQGGAELFGGEPDAPGPDGGGGWYFGEDSAQL